MKHISIRSGITKKQHLLKALMLSVVCLLHPGRTYYAAPSVLNMQQCVASGQPAHVAIVPSPGSIGGICRLSILPDGETSHDMAPAARREKPPFFPIPATGHDDHHKEESPLLIRCTATMRLLLMLLTIAAILVI